MLLLLQTVGRINPRFFECVKIWVTLIVEHIVTMWIVNVPSFSGL